MRIGIVTTWFERGAGYVSRQYRDVLQKEHQVFIYARGGEKYAIGDKKWDDKNVTWGKKIPIHMPMTIDLEDFKKWIKKNHIEIVLFNEQQWWDPVLLCNKLGIKTGAYVDYYSKETVAFFALYDFLICNTRRHYGVFSWHKQTAYIPWGTDVDVFKPQNFNAVKENGFVTFFHSCGVSPERKGTDLLIKAFDVIHGPAKLVIHTQTDLKVFYPELKEIISEMEKSARLVVRTETVPAPGLYYLGDVYVYPTRLEGIGLTIAEASACGLPLIVPDNGPMNEFVGAQNGTLVKVEKYFERKDCYYWPQCEVGVDGLAQAMQYYVDNVGRIPEFKKAARDYAEKYLDWQKNAEPLKNMFNEFILIPFDENRMIMEQVIEYEVKRSNWRTKIYRKFPFVYLPLSWFWPLIKRFYRAK